MGARSTSRPESAHGEHGKVRLQTIGDVVAAYRLHPGTKSGDPRGGLGRRGSVGLLPRLHVRVVGLPIHIGKESNRFEEVQEGASDSGACRPCAGSDTRRVGGSWRRRRDCPRGRSATALNGGMVPHREAREPLERLSDEESL